MEKREFINILKRGGIGVFPTDTLYGLVGSALFPETVERIYKVRGRRPDKPFIILISSAEDLKLFGISPESDEARLAQKYWPGKVSVILPCNRPEFEYLHRGTKTLAFRLLDKPELLKILSATGPLVAPSVNPEGKPPALVMSEAKDYFGELVDFYQDAGRLGSEPSTLIKIEKGEIFIVRRGAATV